jgi:hypothetical protein
MHDGFEQHKGNGGSRACRLIWDSVINQEVVTLWGLSHFTGGGVKPVVQEQLQRMNPALTHE